MLYIFFSQLPAGLFKYRCFPKALHVWCSTFNLILSRVGRGDGASERQVSHCHNRQTIGSLDYSAKTNFHHQTNVRTENTRFWEFSEQVSKSWGYKALAQDYSPLPGSTSFTSMTLVDVGKNSIWFRLEHHSFWFDHDSYQTRGLHQGRVEQNWRCQIAEPGISAGCVNGTP